MQFRPVRSGGMHTGYDDVTTWTQHSFYPEENSPYLYKILAQA